MRPFEHTLSSFASRQPAGDTLSHEPPYDDPEVGSARLANDPDAWLAQTRLRDELRSPWFDRGRYPVKGHVREYFLDPSRELDSRTLRDVLRALLPSGSGPVGSDCRIFEHHANRIIDQVEAGEATEYERRLLVAVLRRKSSSSPAPIPDLTWIIDLAFISPARAFEVANAFLTTHFWILNDQVIDGLYDFMETIRCHFGLDGASESHVDSLRSLPPRALEYLVAALWSKLGYETTVTKQSRDGGRDVIARRTTPGQAETVLIECRQWRKRLPVNAPRELHGVMDLERANKGVIVAPGGFARGTGSATEYAVEARTIELIDGPALAQLLTERFGPEWPREMHNYIERQGKIART